MSNPCPNCGVKLGVEYKFVTEKFTYGALREEQVELEAIVFEGVCKECGFHWTGADAEVSRTEAVVNHLQKTNLNLRRELFELKKVVEGFKNAHKA